MKLNEILKTYKDLIEPYKDASDLEKAILALRNNSYSYCEIQKALGNPSKKFIRQTLLKYDPELIDIDTNYHKLAKKKKIDVKLRDFLSGNKKSEEFWNYVDDHGGFRQALYVDDDSTEDAAWPIQDVI